jgi:hypothetical protein
LRCLENPKVVCGHSVYHSFSGTPNHDLKEYAHYIPDAGEADNSILTEK